MPSSHPQTLIDGALEPLFVNPPRSGVVSAWYGHVPFAFWLMKAVRPRIFVELGTHNGVSYSAFCQAAADHALAVKCYAVDTWRGDEHAGFYDESVFSDFQAFHDDRYAGFSSLLRTSFDEAAPYLADGSIDLLHIDGCHSYEAVRHDFETWRPKLSDRAVVVFHDINVRERGFGVWRLWGELSRERPGFEFVHEHGLGVLAWGAEVDGTVLELCRLSDPADIATLRHRFAQSGLRCAAASERSGREAAEAAVERGEAALAEARHEAERLHLVATGGEARAAEVREALLQTEGVLESTQAELAAAEALLHQKELEIHALRFRVLQGEELIAHYRTFEQAYHNLTHSTTWRALQPLRRAAEAMPAPVRQGVRGGARAAWRAATPWRKRAGVEVAPVEPPEAEPVAELPPPEPLAPPPEDRFSLERIPVPREGYLPLIEWCDPIAPEVSIVVLNWNGGDMTLLCLQHLWQHTSGHRYEIIVVDNGSAPDEVDRLRAQAPLVRVLALGSNRYFGEGNNLGVEAARGRFVCLLNNDAFVSPGWLEPLMAALENEPDVGAAGPRFLYPDGTLQEAGALLNPDGSVIQLGKGAAGDDANFAMPRTVDYISAACLVTRRDDFLRVLGFDLAWDPAYYEDADLCLKLRLIGKRSVYRPESVVVHVEGATSSNWGASLQLGSNVVAINRTKFVDRWGRFLRTAGAERPSVLLPAPVRMEPSVPSAPRMRVVIYTPYQLTPGGGERYMLTLAEALRDIAHVCLVTPQPISRVRLLTMGREFGLALDQIELLQPAENAGRPQADLAFVLGNDLFPTVGGMARHNVFICQFPFPFRKEAPASLLRPNWPDVELVLTYSEYVRTHVLRQIAEWNVPFRPVEVLSPPVPMIEGKREKRRGQILHVGRFIADGHCKRQDSLIEAFRALLASGVKAELHLAGSTMAEPIHRAFYAGLVEQAAGLPVHFHANCAGAELHRLYAESDIYWHATGLGQDVEAEPHVAEHFGISVVEAMSARCVPIVFAAGGPQSIVEDGVTGLHFCTVDELAAKTRGLLEDTPPETVEAMRDAAEAAARRYDEATFRARVREIADRVVGRAPAEAAD